MASVNDLLRFLTGFAPLELQLDFDNSGFLVGHGDAEVKRVLLALDITNDVIEEAIQKEANLIISHHPIIFHPLASLTDNGAGSKVMRLAENRIAAICMHTNLDIADGGVNDVLIRLLGASCTDSLDKDGCGRVGFLPEPLSLERFLKHCKSILHTNGIRYVNAGKPVQKLAVMGGAGADSLRDAYEKGCDTYVTADVKYHQFLDALELGVNLIDADHFCTENPIIPVLAEMLEKAYPNIRFLISEKHRALISFC